MFRFITEINQLVNEKKRLKTLKNEIEQNLINVANIDYKQRKKYKQQVIYIAKLRKKIFDMKNSTKYQLVDILLVSLRNPLKAPKKIFSFLMNYILCKILDRTNLKALEQKVRMFLKKLPLHLQISVLKRMRSNLSGMRQNYIDKKGLPFIKLINTEGIKPKIDHLNIAVIMDKFTYECFKYEARLITFTPDNWKEILIKEKPDFLLVESAWRGNDHSWLGHISDLDKRQESQLPELIQWCKERSIKTVFWNKEDPPNYHRFIAAAKLFDYVFTTDSNCIKKYKVDLGHNNVFCLPFAAQPKIHNPAGCYPKVRNVAFAGSWYEKKHDSRRKQMEYILKPAFEYNLDIYDRNYFKNADQLKFPEKYRPFLAGELSYEEMIYAYKIYKVFLNVNSVTESPTMFSRRVLEILASGTCVISSYSKGIEEMLGSDIIRLSSSAEETRKYLNELLQNEELMEKLAHQGMRRVLKKHTYENRLKDLTKKIGLNIYIESNADKGVSVIAFADSEESIKSIKESYFRQEQAEKELFILFNKNNCNAEKWGEEIKKHNNIFFYDRFVFNIEKTKYDYIAILDDTCFYGKHYLGDLMMAFDYTSAGIVGKNAYYVYLEGDKELLLKNPHTEHCYTSTLSGSTFLIKKEVFKKVQFDKEMITGKKENFLKDCIDAGFKIYSADKYNFAEIKKAKEDRFSGDCEIVDYSNPYTQNIEI